jgi:MoxR-like ATPase
MNLTIEEASKLCQEVVDEISNFIIGKKDVIEKIMIALIANGHILFEDYPGLAKTQITKLFAQTISVDFKRVQFTPDLLPSDITGAYIYDMKEQEFNFRSGPIFTQILLADEINRAPPKTQSALLEAMAEYQVTAEGHKFKLPSPFWVIATQNPIELEGTFGLPEAQLDRFLVKLDLGYPSLEEEMEILANRIKRKSNLMQARPIIDQDTILKIQNLVEEIKVVPEIIQYITSIVHKTRNHNKLEIGASPRGSLALLNLSRANALFQGRNYVIPEDVKRMAVPALSHRLILKTGEWLGGRETIDIILEILADVVAPRKDFIL